MLDTLVSATQVQLFADCERKWGFKYLDGIQTPTHPAALLGTDTQDNQIDPYLLTGRGFDFTKPSGEIANKIAKLLPKPKTPGLRLRRKFVMPSPSGLFAYQGEFDIYAEDSACVPGLGLEGGRKLLADIKTTGNLAYALTSETLKTNIQAQLYAWDVMFEENVDELDLVWFYGGTRKPYRSQLAHVRVDAAHVVGQFERIEASARRLAAIKWQAPKAEELPPNPRMCEQYGGCHYRNICNLSPAVHHAALNEEALSMEATKTADFLNRLRKTAGAAPSAPPAPPPPPPAPPPPPPAAANPFAVPEATSIPAWASAPVDPKHAAKVNPPESALQPAPAVNVPAPAAFRRTRRTQAPRSAA